MPGTSRVAQRPWVVLFSKRVMRGVGWAWSRTRAQLRPAIPAPIMAMLRGGGVVLLVAVVVEEAEEDEKDIIRVCVGARGVKKRGVAVAVAVAKRCRKERVVCISMTTMKLLAYLLAVPPLPFGREKRDF